MTPTLAAVLRQLDIEAQRKTLADVGLGPEQQQEAIEAARRDA